jgi:hypothetical protein
MLKVQRILFYRLVFLVSYKNNNKNFLKNNNLSITKLILIISKKTNKITKK